MIEVEFNKPEKSRMFSLCSTIEKRTQYEQIDDQMATSDKGTRICLFDILKNTQLRIATSNYHGLDIFTSPSKIVVYKLVLFKPVI